MPAQGLGLAISGPHLCSQPFCPSGHTRARLLRARLLGGQSSPVPSASGESGRPKWVSDRPQLLGRSDSTPRMTRLLPTPTPARASLRDGRPGARVALLCLPNLSGCAQGNEAARSGRGLCPRGAGVSRCRPTQATEDPPCARLPSAAPRLPLWRVSRVRTVPQRKPEARRRPTQESKS